MLARENRLQKAEQFRSTMRQGRKVSADHLVIYLKRDEALPHARFGFVVAKSIGGAVKRNLVKRRMRSIAREVLVSTTNIASVNALADSNATATSASGASDVSNHSNSFDVVVRALPGAAEIEWNKLREEFLGAFSKAVGSVAK